MPGENLQPSGVSQQALFDADQLYGRIERYFPPNWMPILASAARSKLFGMPRYNTGSERNENEVDFNSKTNVWTAWKGCAAWSTTAEDVAFEGARACLQQRLTGRYYHTPEEFCAIQQAILPVVFSYEERFPAERVKVMLEPGY